MISTPCIEVQTTSENCFAVPAWFRSRRHHCALPGEERANFRLCASLVRLVGGRFGMDEPIDFLARLFGYAISGERTLADFFERVAPLETAFMALFGRRCLPHWSSLSRWSSRCRSSLLRSVPHALPAAYLRAMPGPRKLLAASSIGRGAETPVFDVDARRQAAGQRALPCDPALPAARRRLDGVCAAADPWRKRGEVVRTRTRAFQMHTRQWDGTYAGRGKGDSRGELASALQAITTYVKHVAFLPQMALVRRAGQYADATVITQLILAGVYSVPRGRGYQLLGHPQIQRVLAHAPTARVTRMNTGQVVELFAGGWLDLGEGLPQVRVIVARHPAPAKGEGQSGRQACG
jgi:hypothetical protein